MDLIASTPTDWIYRKLMDELPERSKPYVRPDGSIKPLGENYSTKRLQDWWRATIERHRAVGGCQAAVRHDQHTPVLCGNVGWSEGYCRLHRGKLLPVYRQLLPMVEQFKVLGCWYVGLSANRRYTDTVTVHPNICEAYIGPCSKPNDEAAVREYLLHELVHVLFAIMRNRAVYPLPNNPSKTVVEEYVVHDLVDQLLRGQCGKMEER